MKKTIQRRPGTENYCHTQNNQNTIDAILRNIFASRGAKYSKHTDLTLANLLRPDLLKGLTSAVALLAEALADNQRVLIIGDFDADGATSTALAIRCLRAFGCTNIDFLVPNRFVFGYGLTPEIVEVAVQQNPDLIVTVDNGISSIEGVRTAKQKNIKILITDHHLPGFETPDADAIVNPNQRGCEFPSKNLAGVGVIFYVMSALRAFLREAKWFEKNHIVEPNMTAFLDLVALGTVADVVPLDFNNRILVAGGLKRMQSGGAAPGIKALLQIANRDASKLSSADLGFALGPRLNAAGRLDDMSLGIRCLLSDHFQEALDIARELDALNRDRKSIESAMQQEALQILNGFSEEELDQHRHGVCLFERDWHQGVVGILASRIKERLHRPTIIFAETDNGELKGSGRSIPGVHMRDVLDEIAATNSGLIEKFGGHAMAAGLSLQPQNLQQFKNTFNTVVERHLDEETIEPIVLSDGELSEDLIHLDLARAIRQAGPWGQNFHEPVFDGVFQIIQQRIVGEKHLKLLLTRKTHSNRVFDAIAFNVDLNSWPNNQIRELNMAYTLDINEYRGNIDVQLVVVYLEAVD